MLLLTLDEYQSGNSQLHKLDPRTRLIGVILLMAAVFIIQDTRAILVFFIITAVLYPVGRIPLAIFFSQMRAFFWLYAITFLIHLLFHTGDKLIQVPILGGIISIEGFQAGLLFTIRIAVLVSLSTLLLALTPPQDMTDALERLFRPFSRCGLSVADGALTISIALRFVPVLLEESEKIKRAQISRGANLEGSWFVRLRNLPPLVIPLFAAAIKRADDLAMALETRGYRGGMNRTRMISLGFSFRDLKAVAVVAFIAFGFWFWR